MIAVDTNILVYAHREDSPFHDVAVEQVTALAEGTRPWAIPWPALHEFLAICTHPRIYNPPTPWPRLVAQVNAWLGSPTVTLLAEQAGYWDTLAETCGKGRLRGAQIHDGRIAAICIQNGVTELWSADRDFSRIPALVVRNPLIGAKGRR
jgi:toxin-antitoxin system PIN domain toxin